MPEFYYFPPADTRESHTRDQALDAFAIQGLTGKGTDEHGLWIVSFEGTSTYVTFQERDGSLSFATVEEHLEGDLDCSAKIHAAIEDGLGWTADEETFG
jgi:hypothetical protein